VSAGERLLTRRLATANRSRVSIRGSTLWKFSSHHHAKFVAVSHTVCVHVRGVKKFGGRWGPAPLRWGLGWPTKTRFCSINVTIPNSVALSRTIWAKGPKTRGRCGPLLPPHWDRGVAELLETRYSPTCVIIPNFVALSQTVSA